VKKPKDKGKEQEVRIMNSDDESESDHGEGEDDEESEAEESADEKEEEFYDNIEERKRTILFEDEKYLKEQNNLTMAYEDLQEYLQLFIENTYGNEINQIKINKGKDHAHREKDSYAIIDLNHEFDDDLSEEINDRIDEEITSKDKFAKKLSKTIAEYEQLIERDAFNDVNEKNDTRKLLRSLKSQLEQHKTYKGEKKILQESIEEKRERALQEIFNFYARQHIPPGLPFEQLEETLKTIQVGELLIFCKDFNVEIPRNELVLLYKKEAENNLPHKFKQFKQSLRKICDILHEKKIKKLEKRLKEIREALGEKSEKPEESGSDNGSASGSDGEGEGEGEGSEHETENKSKKESEKQSKAPEKSPPEKEKKEPQKQTDKKGKGKQEPSKHSDNEEDKESKKSEEKESEGEGSDSGEGSGSEEDGSEGEDEEKEKSESQSVLQERLTEEKTQVVNELEELKSKTKDEVYEEFLVYLELHDPSKYKHKVKGLRLAFDVKDTKSRIPVSMGTVKSKNFFKKNKLSATEIKEKVKEMKEQRLQKKAMQEVEDKNKYDKNRDYLKQIHQKLRHDKLLQSQGHKVGYTDIKIKHMGIPTWEGKHAKVTLDVLKNMHYSDFNVDDDDDFKPEYVLDDEELAKLDSPKKRKGNTQRSVDKTAAKLMTDSEPRQKPANKRGLQVNQSQMSEARNKPTIQVVKHQSINGAYDYAKNPSGMGDIKSVKKEIYKSRDERSVPKMAKSFDIHAYNHPGNDAYPRTKQAMIK